MSLFSPLQSEQYAKFAGDPTSKVPSVEWASKLRTSYATVTADAIGGSDGGTVQMIRLPAGRLRILTALSYFWSANAAAGTLLDFGLGEYIDGGTYPGDTIAADPNALTPQGPFATDGGPGTTYLDAVNASGGVQAVYVDSQGGVDVTMTVADGDYAVDDEIQLYVVYQMGN